MSDITEEQSSMTIFQNILLKLFKSKNTNCPYVAYYVDYEENQEIIFKAGIPLSSDCPVHLLGDLSCAFTKRDEMDKSGKKSVIFKVDISNYMSEFDPAGEEISQQTLRVFTRKKSDETFCHGFKVNEKINPENIIGIEDFI